MSARLLAIVCAFLLAAQVWGMGDLPTSGDDDYETEVAMSFEGLTEEEFVDAGLEEETITLVSSDLGIDSSLITVEYSTDEDAFRRERHLLQNGPILNVHATVKDVLVPDALEGILSNTIDSVLGLIQARINPAAQFRGITARVIAAYEKLEVAVQTLVDGFPCTLDCLSVPLLSFLQEDSLCSPLSDMLIDECVADCSVEDNTALVTLRNGACHISELLANGIDPRTAILRGVLSVLYLSSSLDGAYSLVAHGSNDPALDILNVAYPDFSSEYWVSSFTVGERPHFVGNFPEWANYAALTAYDNGGNLILAADGSPASINKLQLADDARATLREDGTYDIDIMAGVDVDSLLVYCVIERVYRPPEFVILPNPDKFNVYIEGQFGIEIIASNEVAFENSEQVEPLLQLAISSAGGDIQQFDTQLFAPSAEQTEGVFPNANAQYLVNFISADVQAAIFTGRVPDYQPWRPFYGFMLCDQTTTATLSSLNMYDLGPEPNTLSWGSSYKLFVARNLADAVAAGYDETNIEHKVGIFDEGVVEPAVVMRYLHYLEENTGLDVTAAAAEQAQVASMDGTIETLEAIGLDSLPLCEFVYY